MDTIILTAYNLPRKKEAWPVCKCCGEPGMNCAEALGKFNQGNSWPVKHTFMGTTTVFKDKEHVKSIVNKAINLLGNHPMDGCLDENGNPEPMIDFAATFSNLLQERSKDINQLLHTVHDFEEMLVDLFGNREEVKDDAVVWAFAYMMELVATNAPHDTNQIIHDIWDSVMFDSAERARGIRDAAINN